MSRNDLNGRIEELERRVRDLEERSVQYFPHYVPYYHPVPYYPPVPTWYPYYYYHTRWSADASLVPGGGK